ncbi:MAG: four helix bundle protein [Bacteroidetes bacterium]|nr:four helix bundle protein [Bacteroidota bacterium]
MFDYEKLDVYSLIRKINTEVLRFIFSNSRIDFYIRDQWKRATISAALNLAEGSGRTGIKDKKYFYYVSRASIYECVAIIQILADQKLISKEAYDKYYSGYEKVSKMLLGIIRSAGKHQVLK